MKTAATMVLTSPITSAVFILVKIWLTRRRWYIVRLQIFEMSVGKLGNLSEVFLTGGSPTSYFASWFSTASVSFLYLSFIWVRTRSISQPLFYGHLHWNGKRGSVYCPCRHCIQVMHPKHLFVHGLLHCGWKARPLRSLCNGSIYKFTDHW